MYQHLNSIPKITDSVVWILKISNKYDKRFLVKKKWEQTKWKRCSSLRMFIYWTGWTSQYRLRRRHNRLAPGGSLYYAKRIFNTQSHVFVSHIHVASDAILFISPMDNPIGVPAGYHLVIILQLYTLNVTHTILE